MPTKFVGEPFCVSKEFWYRIVSSKGGGSFTVLSEIFSSHRTEKTSPGNHYVFQKISGREKYFMDKRGRGITVLSKFFVSQDRNEKLFKGTLLFSGNFVVSKKIMDKRGLSRFSVEIFMSHSAENFRKGILLFLRKFLVSKSFMDEKFRGHPFNISENLGYRKILCIIGGITIFRLKFFVSQCRKTSYRNPLLFH